MADLMLEASQWDLIPTQGGDIAVCDTPYCTAQSAACEMKLFQGEAYYDATQGLPFDTDILGARPALGHIGDLMEQAALNVPEVATATANVYMDGRELKGAVLLTTTTGTTLAVSV